MKGGLTTSSLAGILDAHLLGPADLEIRGVEPIETASPGSLTFIRSAQFAAKWKASEASAAIVSRSIEVPGHDAASRALLVVEDADRALVALLDHLQTLASPDPPPPGAHPNAHIDPTAVVDPTASVGPNCCVGPLARVGAHSILVANVSIGRGAAVGERCTLHPGVVLYHDCVLGDRCVLHANVTIGADGFGYVPRPDGAGLLKVPHIGNVVVGDDVEIGAGTTVDRGKTGPTTIGDGAKIDNLVQIAHNCTIGPHAVLCGQVGLAGSCTVGPGAMLGGQAGIKDNTSIGARAQIGAQSGVMRDVPDDAVVFGTPAAEASIAFRRTAEYARLHVSLDRIRERIRTLEKERGNNQA